MTAAAGSSRKSLGMGYLAHPDGMLRQSRFQVEITCERHDVFAS